jgi:hypothetical protein
MKHSKLSNVLRMQCAGVAIAMASTAFAQAPEVTELPVHPGDTLRYEVKFDGVDADRIKRVQLSISTNAAIPTDQITFTNGLNGDPVGPVAPDTFRPEIKIADNLVSGEYTLYINVYLDPGNYQYASGKEFQVKPIHIVNTRKLFAPRITVKPLP